MSNEKSSKQENCLHLKYVSEEYLTHILHRPVNNQNKVYICEDCGEDISYLNLYLYYE